MHLPMRKAEYHLASQVCIYCLGEFQKSDLTDEHIVPLHLEGNMVLRKAACRVCAERSNRYEARALHCDLLEPRLLLALKRARAKKRKKIPELPPVFIGDGMGANSDEFNFRLAVEDYPPIIKMFAMEPAGLLVGRARGGELKNFKMVAYHIPRRTSNRRHGITTRTKHDHTSFSLMLAKIGYCYAVAELGIDGFDGRAIRDILMGRRSDIYNFVGGPYDNEYLPRTHLHNLKLKYRNCDKMTTVIVQLFSVYGMPAYEIVVESK